MVYVIHQIVSPIANEATMKDIVKITPPHDTTKHKCLHNLQDVLYDILDGSGVL